MWYWSSGRMGPSVLKKRTIGLSHRALRLSVRGLLEGEVVGARTGTVSWPLRTPSAARVTLPAPSRRGLGSRETVGRLVVYGQADPAPRRRGLGSREMTCVPVRG